MANQTLNNWTGTLAVIGIDWGDSGKGRLVDELAVRAQVVARYNGGSNTGHTVENDFGKFGLHIIPSGIFNKNAKCLIGKNVALDIESLASEMDFLERSGVSCNNLVIDPQATLTMPWHKLRDGLREELRKGKKVGTTGKGVGPTYADRTERVGLLFADLQSDNFAQRLKDEVEIQNKLYGLNLNFKQIKKQYDEYKKMLAPFVGDTTQLIRWARENSKNILFEGAQGYFLDIDAGTYPYVTSSNPGVSGIHRSYDFHPSNINEVVGITKAYTTRVGEGPMPTRMSDETAKFIIEKGNEVGTTTGRVRNPGWLDLVLVKEAIEANKITAIALTKLDVLSGLKSIKLCTEYKVNGKSAEYKSHDSEFIYDVSPFYEEFSGWEENISDCRLRKQLPKNAQKYLKMIEDYTGVTIKFIGVGPKRGEVIYG